MGILERAYHELVCKDPPATWLQHAELMDHDSEHELWIEQAREVQRLRSEVAALESRKKMGRDHFVCR